MTLFKDRSLLRRFFARNMDFLLWTMLLNLINAHFLSLKESGSIVAYIFFGMVAFSLAEAWCLSKFGITPGKKVMALSFNRTFSFSEAFKRSLYANSLGMGLGAMILAPWGWAISAFIYRKKNKMPWDKVEGEVIAADASKFKMFFYMFSIMIMAQTLTVLSLGIIPSLEEESKYTPPETLIESPHEEKKLNKVDTYLFKPRKMAPTAFDEACVTGAVEYARYKKTQIDSEEAINYCVENLRKNKDINYAKPWESLQKSCGVGIAYAIRKIHMQDKKEIPNNPSADDEEFFKTYCEGTYSEQ